MNNAYLNYQSQSIQTMTQGEMINALFEGLIKNCNFAIAYMESKNYSSCHMSIVKAQDIVLYLASTLNPKMEVSQNLFSMYDYFGSQLVDANVKKEPSYIQNILPMIEELKQTFTQADRISRASNANK
jgi:flagellar protein FliS